MSCTPPFFRNRSKETNFVLEPNENTGNIIEKTEAKNSRPTNPTATRQAKRGTNGHSCTRNSNPYFAIEIDERSIPAVVETGNGVDSFSR